LLEAQEREEKKKKEKEAGAASPELGVSLSDRCVMEQRARRMAPVREQYPINSNLIQKKG
jgi:hypothetical protein